MNPQPNISLVLKDRSPSPAEALYYCFILTLPFEQVLRFSGFTVTTGFGLLFFIVSITEWQTFYGRLPRELVVLFGFVGVGIVADIISYGTVDSFAIREFSRPFLVWWLMLAAYNLTLNHRFHRVVGSLYLASLAFACFQSLSLGASSLNIYEGAARGNEGRRVAVLGNDVNFAAMFIAVSVLAGLAYGLTMAKTRLVYRVFFLLGSVTGVYAILKTGSRGGLLALVGGILSLAVTARKWRISVTYMFIVICVLLTIGVTVLNDPYLAARFRDAAERRDTSGRVEIWGQAMRVFTASPLYGFGHYMQTDALGAIRHSGKVGTHNFFLSVLLGSGLAGLLCFLYFYVRAFRSVWSVKTQRSGRIVLAWFLATFVAALSLNMEIAKWFWLVLVLALAAGKRSRRPSTVREAWANRCAAEDETLWVQDGPPVTGHQ